MIFVGCTGGRCGGSSSGIRRPSGATSSSPSRSTAVGRPSSKIRRVSITPRLRIASPPSVVWPPIAELLDPVRSQYKECFVVVRCSFGDEVYSRCVYIWVDKDFALARGWYQGYPKKLGSIWMTRPVSVGRAGPRLEPGGRFGATLAANDRRLIDARFTMERGSETGGFVNALPMLHSRWMPSID